MGCPDYFADKPGSSSQLLFIPPVYFLGRCQLLVGSTRVVPTLVSPGGPGFCCPDRNRGILGLVVDVDFQGRGEGNEELIDENEECKADEGYDQKGDDDEGGGGF